MERYLWWLVGLAVFAAVLALIVQRNERIDARAEIQPEPSLQRRAIGAFWVTVAGVTTMIGRAVDHALLTEIALAATVAGLLFLFAGDAYGRGRRYGLALAVVFAGLAVAALALWFFRGGDERSALLIMSGAGALLLIGLRLSRTTVARPRR